MPMPGMGGSPGAAGSFPALAVVLALFMLGYVIWTTDRLTTLTRARTAAPARSAAWDHARIPVTPGAVAVATTQDTTGTSGATGTWRGHPAGSPMLAPRLAASYKIAMSIAMGYMLIQMLWRPKRAGTTLAHTPGQDNSPQEILVWRFNPGGPGPHKDLNGATGYRSSPRYTSRRCPTTETVTTQASSSTS